MEEKLVKVFRDKRVYPVLRGLLKRVKAQFAIDFELI